MMEPETRLFGLTISDWLEIREERNRYERALKHIGASDVRGKRKALHAIALKALEPKQDPRLTRILLRTTRHRYGPF
jgi:hypothetical protein